MRIFLDASVLIAGLAFRGSAHALLTEGFTSPHRFFASEDVRAETVRVLQESFPRLAAEAEEAVGLVRAEWLPREAYARRLGDFPSLRDPHDAHVLAAAVSARCGLLATWDKDLLSMGVVEGCRVVRPGEALRFLRGGT